uniref:Uncharacterized protein n=1 Tax=Lactuca sativa TaxID=4236 RepID=A0A9R1VRN2_LACSA|nr:hypothetical protein LSAT_V11C400191750 [Lactuca sativa]
MANGEDICDDVLWLPKGLILLLAHITIVNAKDSNLVYGVVSYFGRIKEIWDLDYRMFTIPVFMCGWVDNRRVKKDYLGFTEKSMKAKNTRAHHKYNHRLSTKGYVGLINDIIQETGKTEEEIDRTLLWKKARELKTRGYESDVKMIVDIIITLERLHVEHMMCLQRPWVLRNNVGVYKGWVNL